MPVQRVFLGWDRPCLQEAAAVLLPRFVTKRFLDMRKLVVVVPGGRASRRFLEILALKAKEVSLPLFPPRIITAGQLPELFYAPSLPFAGSIQRTAAWMEALLSVPKSFLEAVLPKPPSREDIPAYAALAARLNALWEEIAGAGLSFVDVAVKGAELPDFSEGVRWEVLERVFQVYLERLKAGGFSDQHVERKNFLLSAGSEASTEEIALIACVELKAAARNLLSLPSFNASALVFAPEAKAGCFDEIGCIIAKMWKKEPISVVDDSIVVGDRPIDQAAEVVKALSRLGKDLSVEDVTIGVADDALLPFLCQEFEAAHVPLRAVPGKKLSASGPVRLLRAAARYLEGRRFVDLASLCREGDLSLWFEKMGSAGRSLEEMICLLDRYHREHLPFSTEALAGEGGGADCEVLRFVGDLQSLLGELQGPPQSLCEWPRAVGDFFVRVYGGRLLRRDFDEDVALIEASKALKEVLGDMSLVSASKAPLFSASQALFLAAEECGRRDIPPRYDEKAVEALGWLELSLDDAPFLIVAGMNEGRVPDSVNEDAFLPNSLRSHLELLDNNGRLARDTYALITMLQSKEKVILAAGRRDADGEPLKLSRLLLSSQDRTLAERVSKFYGKGEGIAAHGFSELLAANRSSSFRSPPEPICLQDPVREMSVTSFKDYLACPYRFYLRHVLGLDRFDDRALEMDGALFGQLMHEVLFRFAGTAASESEDEKLIRSALSRILDAASAKRFGAKPLPSVELQVEQLRFRLLSFARWQAQRISEGWRIHKAELGFSGKDLSLDLGGGRFMGIRGRIDRIDRHVETGEWVILDYKTGDRVSEPAKTHRRRDGKWLDFQLPLYDALFKSRANGKTVHLGYVAISGSGECEELRAEWSETDLEEAVAGASEIARSVWDGVFWPPTDKLVPYDDFSDLCGVGFLGDASTEEEAG